MSPPVDLSRRAFLAAGALAFAAACSSGDPGEADPASTTGPARGSSAAFIDRGPDTRDRVALTFHTNGDLDLAAKLLDVLAARDTVITAFVVGDWLTANPSWGPRLRDAGHEVANHTFTHPTFLTLPRDAMLDEIVRCRDALARDAGSPGRFFRPSGTDDGTTAPPAVVLDVAAEAGYATVLGFDVDPFDYDDPGADAVVQRTLAAVRPGSIVSLHFGHPGTNAAMPALLDGLEERGLQPVTASKLLG